MYPETLTNRSAEIESRLWNSTNGFWKYTLMKTLIRGCKHSVRFCCACWFFRPYRETSREFWYVTIPSLSTTVRWETCRVLGGYHCYFPIAPHRTGAWLFAFRMVLHEDVQRISNFIRDPTYWNLESHLEERLRDYDDFRQYQNNWEVRLWLGEQVRTGVNTSRAEDKEIRCPSCLLMDNPLRLQDRSMKVVWPKGHPDSSIVMEDTSEGRARLLGYHQDRRSRGSVIMRTINSHTGSHKDRQRKKRKEAAIAGRIGSTGCFEQ